MKYSQHIVENNDYVNSENWQVPDYSCHHTPSPWTIQIDSARRVRVKTQDVFLFLLTCLLAAVPS
jgi:hypothetical protein